MTPDESKQRACLGTFGAVMVIVLLAGCAKDDPGDLVRNAFARPQAQPVPVRRPNPEDQAGQIMYNDLGMNLLNPEEVKEQIAEEEAARVRVSGLSPAIREAVTLPSATAAKVDEPSTRPLGASPAAPKTTGGYLQLGAVVTTVNGQPIYADKVLASLDKVFAAEAPQRDERAFRTFAKQAIEAQVKSFIRAELEVAAARKNLDPREERLASDFTTQWRQQQITLAGGSLEKARAKAAAEGYSFDEHVDEKSREVLVQLYYQKRIFPRVQVSAEDVRRYYNQHLKSDFTQREEAQFRVIRIDASRTGGEDKARQKIDAIRQRALNGEDFAKIAASTNDDPSLMRAAGDVGVVPHGAFALEALEQAVWELQQPGQITEVVQIDRSFYIAKLEMRKDGSVRPFEDEEVQRKIKDVLQKEQIASRREVQFKSLLQDAVIYPDPPVIDPVLEMAMQKYSQWASAR